MELVQFWLSLSRNAREWRSKDNCLRMLLQNQLERMVSISTNWKKYSMASKVGNTWKTFEA